MKLVIQSRVLAEVYRHGSETYPAECCGFMLGRWSSSDAHLDQVVRARNTRAGERNDVFEIEPRQYLQVERELRGTGRQILGFYHSHPDHPDLPSFTDLGFAKGWPGFLWMIASVVDGTAVTQQTYRLDQDEEAFVRVPCEVLRLEPPSEKAADYHRMREILNRTE